MYSDSTQLHKEFEIFKSFLIFIRKKTKNVISQKLQGIEQLYLEASFVTPESTLTAPNYKVKNFKFGKNNSIFLKLFEKIAKNVMTRTLQGFEQSYFEVRFATTESALTAHSYRVKDFKF